MTFYYSETPFDSDPYIPRRSHKKRKTSQADDSDSLDTVSLEGSLEALERDTIPEGQRKIHNFGDTLPTERCPYPFMKNLSTGNISL